MPAGSTLGGQMQDPFETATMTPEERAREVAAILARGYLRYSATRPKQAPPSTENALDESGNQTAPCDSESRPCAGPDGKESR